MHKGSIKASRASTKRYRRSNHGLWVTRSLVCEESAQLRIWGDVCRVQHPVSSSPCVANLSFTRLLLSVLLLLIFPGSWRFPRPGCEWRYPELEVETSVPHLFRRFSQPLRARRSITPSLNVARIQSSRPVGTSFQFMHRRCD